jgi:glycosyltransferase involved in cell wall biosynthesis
LAAIREAGFRVPVAVIPNGIDIPEERVEMPGLASKRRLLFLGRLHPTKGIDALLRAWTVVAPRFADWELAIVGPDDGGHRPRLESLAAELRAPRITFVGPLYGDAKHRALSAASLFVLPTHTENFGIAVAEALAAGLPAIVCRGAPWQGLERERCGWWIENGVDPLISTLEEALALPSPVLTDMGLRGRAWMRRDFSWEKIGRDMAALYRWLVKGGEQPPFVQCT